MKFQTPSAHCVFGAGGTGQFATIASPLPGFPGENPPELRGHAANAQFGPLRLTAEPSRHIFASDGQTACASADPPRTRTPKTVSGAAPVARNFTSASR